MKVIFLADVKGKGRKYEIKEVPDGFAQNMLLPKKLALKATDQVLADIEKKRKSEVSERALREDLLLENLHTLESTVLEMKGNANSKGHLFSSIHADALRDTLLKEKNIIVPEGSIKLEKPIKELGEFTVPVEVKGKKSFFKVVVEKA